MEFCDQSWNFTNFAPTFCQICMFVFFTTKKLNSNPESAHFLMFSAKWRKCKIGKRDQVCGTLHKYANLVAEYEDCRQYKEF